MFRGLSSIIYKETIHIVRDPRTLFLMLLVPGVELIIFGYAIDLDVKHIPMAVYNLDGRAQSRELIDAFKNTGSFDVTRYASSDEALNEAIVRGQVQVGLKIPPDYSDKVWSGQNTAVQVLIDGSSSTVAMQALNVSNAIALRESLAMVSELVGGRAAPPIESRPRVLFNPDMRTAVFMVPGLVGIVMQVVIMLLTAFAVVKEKEHGTLEQLMVTPVSRLGLMLGKLIPYAFVGAFETTVVVCLMRFLFQVPIAGSVFLLAALSLLFLFTVLGMGLLISTLASSQMQAIQVSFLIVLPSVLLSGFIFPQESMPYPIYLIGQAIPVTYFIRILRGIIIRGAGFMEVWRSAAVLGGMGLFVLALSAFRFHKTVS